jgi:hypothetical protein
MATSNTLKSRITRLLPAYSEGTTVTVKQLVARLNRSTANPPVANATVRGRLSELVAAGVANSEERSSGVTGFYSAT